LAGYWRVVSPHADDPTPDPGEDIAENRPNGRPIQMRTAYLFMAAVTVMLMGCASSPSPDDTRRLAEGNRWELVRWGDRTVPHGDNGEPVILQFKDGRASGHAGCNRYSTRVTFGPGDRQVTVSPGMTTRMACEPRRMEFEGAFIRAFETSTGYRVEGERLVFESGVASPMEFYRRPLER
jgi:heat shock protein HslJ